MGHVVGRSECCSTAEERMAIASERDGHGPNGELIPQRRQIRARKFERTLATAHHMRNKTSMRTWRAMPRSTQTPSPQLLGAVSTIAS